MVTLITFPDVFLTAYFLDVIPNDTADNEAIVVTGSNVDQVTLHEPNQNQLREWQATAQLAQKVAIDAALEAYQQVHQGQIVQMRRNYEGNVVVSDDFIGCDLWITFIEEVCYVYRATGHVSTRFGHRSYHSP